MKRLIIATLFLSTLTLAAQTTPPGATPPVPVKVEVVPAKTALSTDHLKDAAELAIAKQDTASARAQILQGQLDAAMKQQMEPLQAEYAAREKIINEYVDTVKKANNWGDDVTFDKATMKFYQTTKPTPAPAPSEPEKPVAPPAAK